MNPDDARELVVLSRRDKPNWTDPATIEIAERYYRIAGVEERPDGDRTAVAYPLHELGAGAIVRRLVRYVSSVAWEGEVDARPDSVDGFPT